MPSQYWNPDDWQQTVNLWLTTRYALGDYQKVPDKHVGDFGFEGLPGSSRAISRCALPSGKVAKSASGAYP